MVPQKNFLKDLGRVLFWFPLRWMLLITPLSLVYRLGGWLGNLNYVISRPDKINRMRDNVSAALGRSPQETTWIIRQNLKMHLRNTLELIKYPKTTKAQIKATVTFKHKNRLDAALQEKGGVVLLTAHFGAKQLLQIALGRWGYDTNQIHYHMRRDELTFIQKHVAQFQRKKIESQLPVNFIHAKRFLRPAFRCLKENQVLIMAGDGIGQKKYIDRSYSVFDIFGKQMSFPMGPAAIARRTGATLLPVFVVRRTIKHHIVFEKALKIEHRSDIDVTAAYVKLLERYIRQHPWQWEFWEEFDESVLLQKAK